MATFGPAGASLFIPTGPVPNYEQLILDDPFYKQNLTWLADQERIAKERLAQDKTFSQQMFDLSTQQANQQVQAANASADVALGNATAQAQLQRDQAAAANAARAEYLREWLASRGLANSGQRGLEQAAQAQEYGFTLRGIDESLQGTSAGINQDKANRQASLALQLQELSARQQAGLLGYEREAEDAQSQYARQRGQAALDTYNRLLASGRLNQPGVNAVWDPESGLYVTANGEYYAVDSSGNPYKTTWNRAPQAPSPAAYEQPYVPQVDWQEAVATDPGIYAPYGGADPRIHYAV